MIATTCISQPIPSSGIIISIGAPALITLIALPGQDMPIANSPEPACLQGFEPECVYIPMFS